MLIREVDPPFDGQFTAIGLTPLLDRSKVKKILSTLPLLGKTDMSKQCDNAQHKETSGGVT